MPIRIGLIGLGKGWLNRIRPALRALSDLFEIVAICDPVAARAVSATDDCSAAVIRGYNRLIRREDIDAILVLEPGWYSVLPVLAALEAKKPVYWARGWEADLSGALEICRRAQERHLPLGFAFWRRHAPATIRLKELIATRLGPVELAFIHKQQSCGENRRIGDLSQSDPIRHELVELAEWCCYIMDQAPQRITGLANCPALDDGFQESFRSISLEFGDGQSDVGRVARVDFERSRLEKWPEASGFRSPAELRVICRDGIAFIDMPGHLVWFDQAGRHQESLEDERPVDQQILSCFHRVAVGEAGAAHLEEAARALEIVQKAIYSSFEGRSIELKEETS
jgi:predicted dehydrogenase